MLSGGLFHRNRGVQKLDGGDGFDEFNDFHMLKGVCLIRLVFRYCATPQGGR
jgi:hypothetical protein